MAAYLSKLGIYMWKSKRVIIVLVHSVIFSLHSQIHNGVVSGQYFTGPMLGIGISNGLGYSDIDIISAKSRMGVASKFGGMFQYKLTPLGAVNTGLLYEQNNRNVFTTTSNASLPIYKIREENLTLPIDFIRYFSQFRQRVYIGVGPLFSISRNKNLLLLDTANYGNPNIVILINQKQNYQKFTLGLSAKVGFEFPIHLKETGRIYLEYFSRMWIGKYSEKAKTFGICVIGQYCWGG